MLYPLYPRYILANISKASNYHLFRIRCIRKHINRSLCSVLINTLIIYRIYYSYSLLYSLTLPPFPH